MKKYNMENKLDNINKRAGTTGPIQGFLYEIQVIFLFMIRSCLKNVKFTLANNIKEFGNFDDLVASCVLSNGTKKLIGLQSKHLKNTGKNKINLKSLTNEKEESFYLSKYREEIRKADSRVSDYKDIDVDLIFYTTVSIDDTDKSLSWCNVDENDILCKLLDTSEATQCVMKFSESGNEELLTSVKNDKDFIQRITIFSQQCRGECTETIIKDNLRMLVGNYEEIKVHNIYKSINYRLQEWYQDETAQSLLNEKFISWIWENILYEVSCLFLEAELSEFSLTFSVCDDRIDELRKQIADYRTLVIKSENTSTFLVALEVHQAVKDNPSHMFVNLQNLGQVLPLFEHCKDLIVVDCSEVSQISTNSINKLLNTEKFNRNKKVIFLVTNKAKVNLDLVCDEVLEYKFNLRSLTPDSQKYILAQHIELQGKSVQLCNIFEGQSICDVIDSLTVEKLLKNVAMHVGGKLTRLNEETETCYIERSYHNTHLLDRKVLDINTASDILIVCVKHASDLGKHQQYFQNYEKLNENSALNKIYFIDQSRDVNRIIFKTITAMYPGKNIHLLEITHNNILWITTAGISITNIRKFVTTCTLHNGERSITGESEDSLLYSSKKLNIIINSAGKGKTTALHKIAENLQTKHTACLILYYDLNNPEMFAIFKNMQKDQQLKQMNAEELLKKYFFSKFEAFELAVFLHLVQNNKVIFCFDGFDEISQRYDKECMSLIKRLQSVAKQIWLTSREHMESYIQEHLPTLPIKLLPITEQDQIDFYIRYFKYYIGDNKLFDEKKITLFANDVMSSIAEVDESIVDFMGIPLLTKMLASINIESIKKVISSNVDCNQTPVTFTNLFNLYQKFFDLSITRYVEEKIKLDTNAPHCDITQEIEKRMQYFMIFTFSALMDKSYHSVLTEKERKLAENRSKFHKNVAGVGIITILEQDNMKFLHFTFAEFLVASFVSQKLTLYEFNSNIPAVLDDVLHGDRWKMVRKFLNNSPYINYDTQNNDQSYQNIKANFLVCLTSEMQKTREELTTIGTNRENNDTVLHIAVRETNLNLLKFTINCLEMSESRKYLSLSSEIFLFEKPYSALHLAVRLGRKEEVNLFLDYKGDTFNMEDSTSCLLLTAASYARVDVVTVLLDRGADVNHKNKNGETALIQAVWSGHVDVVTLLLDRSADIHHKEEYGRTALIRAAWRGHVDMVTVLLDRGADIDHKEESGETALIQAAGIGHVEVVTLLLNRGANVNQKEKHGETALIRAAVAGHVDVVTLLLDRGADVNEKDKCSQTALIQSALIGYVDVVILLLDRGAVVNGKDKFGKTALMQALCNGQVDVVTVLLDRDADVNHKDKEGKTMLIQAAKEGHVDMVTLLLDHGADINQNDEYGQTAMILAALSNYVDVLTLLLGRGADINHKDKDGQTALILATKEGHVDVVTLLLDRGADVHEADKYNITAILTAAMWSTVVVVELLLARGASLDDKDKRGRTLLMWTARNRSHDVITYVVSQGRYDIHDRDNNGRTALHHAAERGHSLNVKTLLDFGADINSQDDDGNTPLHWAVKSWPPRLECVQYLCQRGADRSVNNKSGETVLDVECFDHKIAQWLRQKINHCDIEVKGELTNE